MIVQHCDYSKCHWSVHLKRVKMVNFILCVFYHNNKNTNWKEWNKIASIYRQYDIENPKQSAKIILELVKWVHQSRRIQG